MNRRESLKLLGGAAVRRPLSHCSAARLRSRQALRPHRPGRSSCPRSATPTTHSSRISTPDHDDHPSHASPPGLHHQSQRAGRQMCRPRQQGPDRSCSAISARCPTRSAPRCATISAVTGTTAFFWDLMTPGGAKEPAGDLKAAIDRDFKSPNEMMDKLNAAGLGRFGSGWAWLIVNKDKKLDIVNTPYQDTPHMDLGGQAGGRRRCLGARLLPEIPEPPRRLSEGVVEHGELGQGRRPLQEGDGLISARS